MQSILFNIYRVYCSVYAQYTVQHMQNTCILISIMQNILLICGRSQDIERPLSEGLLPSCHLSFPSVNNNY